MITPGAECLKSTLIMNFNVILHKHNIISDLCINHSKISKNTILLDEIRNCISSAFADGS